MIALWILLGLAVLNTLAAIAYKWWGYRLDWKIVSLAYADGHLINWHFVGGQRVRNERDDSADLRHIPRKVRDHGFSLEPLYFRITFKKTVPIKGQDGSGREYTNAEERLRVHERMRHGRVLPDYTDDDYPALVGTWTPEQHAAMIAARNAKRDAKRAQTPS
jgi:hypothetical protein